MAGLQEDMVGGAAPPPGAAPGSSGPAPSSLVNDPTMQGPDPGAGGGLVGMTSGPQQGGALFPRGFDVANLISSDAWSMEEKVQSNDAATVGVSFVEDANVSQLIQEAAQGGQPVPALAKIAARVVDVFNDASAAHGGISSLMWFSGVTAIIDHILMLASQAGAQLDADAPMAVWPEVVEHARGKMVERGWVTDAEMQEFLQALLQRSQEVEQEEGPDEMAAELTAELGPPDGGGGGMPPAGGGAPMPSGGGLGAAEQPMPAEEPMPPQQRPGV